VQFLRRFGALALALSLLATAPASTLAAAKTAVLQVMNGNHIPGSEVAAVQNGILLIDRGYGLANIRTKRRVTADTHFEIGSVTKQFTAAAILQLKEQGKLRLSDPLGKYVPEYPRAKNVTIEQLLWQVSGIPNYTEANHFVSIASHSAGGLGPALALIKNEPLHFKPGTRWEYSNTNYLLLGAIAARVSHMPWSRYLRENVFSRAGLMQTAFVEDEPHLQNMASGYQLNKKGAVVAAPLLHSAWAGGAGAIVSTAADLVKWDGAFFGGEVISPADVTLATTAHTLPSGRSTKYGFGWVIDTFDGEKRIWHNGGTSGYGAQNEYFPDLHEAVAALANSASADPASVATAAFEVLNPAVAAAARKAVPGENPKITALARRWMQRAETGNIDRSQLDAKMSAALTPAVVKGGKAQFGPLGKPTAFIYRGKTTEGTSTIYTYRVDFKAAAIFMHLGINNKGKISELDFTGS
jgi:D-alanyl-D-alanine carboxypeptidase